MAKIAASKRPSLRERRLYRQVVRQWGKSLRAARIKAGFTQVELGRQSGLSGLHISKWEAGSDLPDAKAVAKLRQFIPDLVDVPDLATVAEQMLPEPGRVRSATLPSITGPHADFAVRLRSARLMAGMARGQLAISAQVSAGSIANWETGGHLPQRAPLLRLREALGQHWGTAEQPKSLAAWEAGALRGSDVSSRSRGRYAEAAYLRRATTGAPGAYAFVAHFLEAIAAGRLTGAQVGLFTSLLRQLTVNETKAAPLPSAEPEPKVAPKKVAVVVTKKSTDTVAAKPGKRLAKKVAKPVPAKPKARQK